MRRLFTALAVLCVVIGVPVASAQISVPSDGPVEIPDAPQNPEGVQSQLDRTVEAAEQAAGVDSGDAPVEPIMPAAPADDSLFSGFAIAGVAVLGLAGAAIAGAFYGGARFVSPAEVLTHDVRRRIYAHLRANVGANLKQITDDLALTTTNAIWHLRKLEDAGVIHSRRFNGYKVFYPAEGGVEARRMSLGKTALANENAQEVFSHVVTHPGTHQREIARALGVNHGTVRWHLKKLMAAELIVEARRGKSSFYEPTQTGLAALRQVEQPTTVAA